MEKNVFELGGSGSDREKSMNIECSEDGFRNTEEIIRKKQPIRVTTLLFAVQFFHNAEDICH